MLGKLTEMRAVVEFLKDEIYKFNKHIFAYTLCQSPGSKRALQMSGADEVGLYEFLVY